MIPEGGMIPEHLQLQLLSFAQQAWAVGHDVSRGAQVPQALRPSTTRQGLAGELAFYPAEAAQLGQRADARGDDVQALERG